MYEDHYGLRHRPFSETVSLAAYVALPSRDAALRRLRYGLQHGHGPAVLFGPPGSGKTLIARCLAAEIGVSAVHLTFPALPGAELLTLLAEEFGGPFTEAPTMAVALRQLRDQLAATVSTGHHPLLIVDEAFGPCGIGAEIAAQLSDRSFDDLDAPIRRLNGTQTPTPYSPPLEAELTVTMEKIMAAVLHVLNIQ